MMPNESHQKIVNIQALRGVAVLLVVFAHVGSYEKRFFDGHAYLDLFTTIGAAGVDLFFVISGFVMMAICHGGYQKKKAAPAFFLRRVARIYPLYWVFTLLYLPIFLFYPQMMNRQEGAEGVSLVRSFLLLPGLQVPLVGQGWTLVHEMYFYLVFSIALFFPEPHKVRFLAIWSALIVVGFALTARFDVLQSFPLLMLASDPLTFEFIAGCVTFVLISKGCRVNSRLLVVLGALGLLVPGIMSLPFDRTVHVDRMIICLLPATLLVLGAVSLERRNGIILPKFLTFVGDISYSVYLSHMIVVSGAHKLFRFLDLGSSTPAHLFYVALSIALACGAGAAIHFLLERPLLRVGYATVRRLLHEKAEAAHPLTAHIKQT